MTHPFDKFTDATAMGEIFQARLWPSAEAGPKVLGCEILFAHHKAYLGGASRHRSYLALCYGLQVSDVGEPAGALMFHAKAYLGNRSCEEIAAVGADWYWPDLKLAVWRFPRDPKMPHLPLVIDPAAVREHLPYDALPAGYDISVAVARIRAEVIHYYPEERCTCRYELESNSPGGSRPLSLYGKTFNQDRGESAYRNQLKLWRITQRQTRKFIVARPLGYSAKVKTLWLEPINGVPAVGFLKAAAGQGWLNATAEGLANLHRLAPIVMVQHRRADQLQDLHSKSKKLLQAFPDLAALLTSLQRDLEGDAANWTGTRQSFIHGDFHLRQLLVHGEQIAVLDFDECGAGDALQDVASFLVDLYFYDLSADEAAGMGRQFLQAYQYAAEWEIPIKQLDWQVRLQFFTKAYRVYRQHQNGREEKIAALLSLAERGLAGSAAVRSVAPATGERSARL